MGNLAKARRLAGRAKTVIQFAVDVASSRRDVAAFLKYCTPGGNSGTIDTEEFNFLIELAAAVSHKDGALIEIGTLFGFSTQALALGKRPNQPLITVDRFSWNPIGLPPWRHKELTFSNLTFLTQTQNVSVAEMSCEEFYANWNGGAPSLVFIDAGHSYEAVRADIDWAVQVSASLICGDDYSWPGVKQAVNEVFPGMHTVRGDLWAVEL